MDSFIVIMILGILGAAFIAGGIVMYRGSTRAGFRASGAALIAAGVVMWAIILFTQVASVTSG